MLYKHICIQLDPHYYYACMHMCVHRCIYICVDIYTYIHVYTDIYIYILYVKLKMSKAARTLGPWQRSSSHFCGLWKLGLSRESYGAVTLHSSLNLSLDPNP